MGSDFSEMVLKRSYLIDISHLHELPVQRYLYKICKLFSCGSIFATNIYIHVCTFLS